MDIVYVFDDKFSVCAAVSMISVIENNKDEEIIRFFVFDDGITDDSKAKLKHLCDEHDVQISFVDIRLICERLKTIGVQPWRGRYSAYVKLMISDYLPPKIERVVVLDADTVVAGNICELFSMDLHGHPCAMALEGIPAEYYQIAGIGNSELYNTGVIVYDLPAWREKCVEARFIHHLTHVRSQYMLPEEDPISIVLRDDVERLSPKFNFITLFHYYGSEKYFKRFGWNILGDKFYTVTQLEEARQDIRIHHCTDTFTSRPWFKDNIHPYTPFYDQYLKMSPWKDTPKCDEQLSGLSKAEYMLRKYLPQSLSDYMYFVACKLFYTVKAKRFYKKEEC